MNCDTECIGKKPAGEAFLFFSFNGVLSFTFPLDGKRNKKIKCSRQGRDCILVWFSESSKGFIPDENKALVKCSLITRNYYPTRKRTFNNSETKTVRPIQLVIKSVKTGSTFSLNRY